MRIAFVTPELQSLLRRTSLAEVSESLSRTLRQEGADIRVFLPIRGRPHGPLAELRPVGEVRVKDGTGRQNLIIHTALLGDLPVVLVDHPQVIRPKHTYGDEEGPYSDNWRRYAPLQPRVLESFAHLNFEPDIIQAWIGRPA